MTITSLMTPEQAREMEPRFAPVLAVYERRCSAMIRR